MAAVDNPPYMAGAANPSSQEGDFTVDVLLDAVGYGNGHPDSTTLWPPEQPHATFTFQTFVTMFTTLVCVVGNSLILIVAGRTSAFDNFNRCYVFSMTTADLFLGLFVTPFCIFNTLYGTWVFKSNIFCCVEAYLMALFIIVSMISMAFLIVDHYVAVRKPDRYGVMMSFNRSLCWIVLTWVIATSFCCPPLFALQKAFYYNETFLCVIDRQHQQTYFMTVTFMITLPTVVAILVTSRYLFTLEFKDQKKFYQRVYDHFSERSWNYYISFVITAMFFVTWLPFTIIRVAQSVQGWQSTEIHPQIHFFSMWFGLSNCFSKFIVYVCMSPQFRQGLREVCELQGGGGGGRGGYTFCGSGSAASLDHDVITAPRPRN